MAATAGALLLAGQRSLETTDVEGIRDADEEPAEEEGDEEEGDEEDEDEVDVEEVTDVLHVLVVGSDRRDNLSSEEQSELGTGDEDGDRTDTIMLLRVDPTSDEVHLLSFPRDLLVTRCDGTQGKINAAYHIGELQGIGGPSCLVQTIGDMSGIEIDHYVEVDFAGFMDVVDVVDGVGVYLEHDVDDWRANLHLEAGCHELSGVEALGFVRTRKYDSDYGRIARQQRFITQLVEEASSLSTVLNLPRMLSLVETAASAVTTDQNLTLDKMRRIAFSLRDLGGDHVVARTVPAEFQMMDEVAYEIPYESQARQLYRAFESGGLTVADDDEDPEPEQPEVEVADVPSFAVLNTSNVDGLAASFSEALGAEGFAVTAVDNADATVRGAGEVRHPPHLTAEAELLASYLPDIEAFPIEGLEDIELLIGGEADPAFVAPPAEDDGGQVAEGEGDDPGDDGQGAEGGDAGAEDDDDAGAEDDEGAGGGERVEAPPPLSDEDYVGAQEPPPSCGF
ncbi:MAG: LCP family protein [Egibacteraceae bacterium]